MVISGWQYSEATDTIWQKQLQVTQNIPLQLKNMLCEDCLAG